MTAEAELLRAVVQHPFDQTYRLVYADWLEEHGDARAEYLRLQAELSRASPPRPEPWDGSMPESLELCRRERELLEALDPAWLHRVARFTTAPPCRDVAKLVPELAPFARTTTRLHPHRMVGERPADESKIGGNFLWPQEEEWPVCPSCRVPLAPILQLRSYDVPDIEFFPGTDTFQLLWCVWEAEHEYRPEPFVYWRQAASVTRPRAMPARAELGAPRRPGRGPLLPHPCSIYPERVCEYPDQDDLYALAGPEVAGGIWRKMEDKERADQEGALPEPFTLSLYFYELSRCPGSKVGGKPAFANKEARFEHLLTLSSWEFDSANFRRWLPVEDQRRPTEPGQPLTQDRLFRAPSLDALQEAIGMQLGRTQKMHLYVCRTSPSWPVELYIGD
jgi:uncharacterized protein (TIGR02996 family)